MKVLILDENLEQGRQVKDYLERHSVNATLAEDRHSFERGLAAAPPDIVVLGVDLAEKSGFQLLNELRRNDTTVPVLMLSKRDELPDRLMGFELGADDYLCRPCENRELLARLNALARRNAMGRHCVTRYGPLSLDHGRRVALLNGRDLELTANEFEALAVLAAHAGRILTRTQLKENLRGMGQGSVDGRGLDIMVSRLRKRLGDDARESRFIKTVYGAGYLFLAQEGL